MIAAEPMGNTSDWYQRGRAIESRERRGAAYDALPDRETFLDELRDTLLVGDRARLAVLVIALDRWASLDAALDRTEIEALMEEFARRVVRHASPWLVARTRRGELAILVEGHVGRGQPADLASRLLRVMRAPFRCGDRRLALSASAGIAHLGAAAVSWLQDADSALQGAQSEGGGRVVTFHSERRAEALRRVEMESELRHALRHGHLRVRYQPIVDPVDGRLVGLEALVRWKHARLGTISPAEFVPLAESSGMIHELGRFVRGTVLAQMAQWTTDRGPLADVRVSINISAAEFARPGLVEMIADELGRYRVEATRVWLELTESQRVTDLDSVAAQVSALRAIGVSVVLDDFATGYSSLQLLMRLQVRAIKLERTFVAGLGRDAGCEAIVAAAFALAGALGLAVIPEGIETEQQAEALRRLGCRTAQGYLWSPALAPGELAVWQEQRAAESSAIVQANSPAPVGGCAA